MRLIPLYWWLQGHARQELPSSLPVGVLLPFHHGKYWGSPGISILLEPLLCSQMWHKNSSNVKSKSPLWETTDSLSSLRLEAMWSTGCSWWRITRFCWDLGTEIHAGFPLKSPVLE